MNAKHLVIGWDGADLDVIEQLGEQNLPVLFSLMKRGSFGASESVQPPATLPNWTSFLTGVNPGRHGVFDFTSRDGYSVKFTGGTIRELPTWLSALDRAGKRVACLSFPATWPPEKLANGLFMSGWDSPVSFRADKSFVWPAHWYSEIAQRFGVPTFDDVDEFSADAPGWLERLAPALERRIERKTALCEWLLQRQHWDVFAVYFGESDTASHYLWPAHDPYSPRRPDTWQKTQPFRAGAASPLAGVYRALDKSLGALIAQSGEGTNITLISDHGSGGATDKVVYLNRALEQAGLLRFRSRSFSSLFARAKRWSFKLPPAVREQIFLRLGRFAPSWLESHARFSAIDMRHTMAFSDEVNYFPAVYLNLAGREPRGQVREHQRATVGEHIERALGDLRDPWSDAPIVKRVIPREQLFAGPWLKRAPDFLLELHFDERAGQPYSYNLMPSSEAGPPVQRLPEHERLGKKGRSLPGAHRSHGFWCASGPAFAPAGRQSLHILDASATLVAALGCNASSDGKVLTHCLAQAPKTQRHAQRQTPPDDHEARPRADARKLAQRMRALGYID